MITEQKYNLCGYIEYVTTPIGFVTPVFKNLREDYFVQVSAGSNKNLEWIPLQKEYSNSIKNYNESILQLTEEAFVYGFKWNSSVYFATGKDMAAYLTSSFLPKAEVGKDLAIDFINDWLSLEPTAEVTNKERIWKKCLDIIEIQSKTLPAVFRENFDIIGFENGRLNILSKNESIKKVFETQFQNLLLTSLSDEIPGFNISFIKHHEEFTPLPFVYFGGSMYPQGSFFIETKINSFQDFDNFIVGSFNEQAYFQALDFIESESNSLITIYGEIGVGKTHLINSIAQRLANGRTAQKVGLYSFFSTGNTNADIPDSEFLQLERSATFHDVIIIDDVHTAIRKKTNLRRLTRLLKKWKDLNKSVVLSIQYNNTNDINIELSENSEQLVLNMPDEFDKLRIFKSKAIAHNIPLSGIEISRLAEDKEINTVADIQKYVTRLFIADDIRTDWKDFIIPYRNYHLNRSRIESYVYDYVRFNMEHFSAIPPIRTQVSTKVISHFIQDLFSSSHHGEQNRPDKYFVDGAFYSFDILQYYLFQNKVFKTTVSEILRELILRDKKDE